jgi:N-acetylglucosaminyl-diphospho-decaprenol L-rhamnosyltransferase
MISTDPPSARIAVAVVSWNTRDLLATCLESFRPDVEAGRAEVWVVDNASDDESAQLVANEYSWVKLIASTRNLGFGAAVNAVAERTSSAWVAPANADIRLEPGALKRLLEAGEGHSDAGAVAPRLIAPDGSTQHSVFPLPTVGFTLLFNLGVYRLSRRLADRWCLVGHWNPDQPRRVPWAVAAFLLVRRTAWDEVGGFDENQWMYAEDLDLGWRLQQVGWHTLYEPSARVHHVEAAATSQRWGENRAFQWQASTYAWMLRRRGGLVTRATALINMFGAAIRGVLLTPGALVRPARWGQARRNAWMAARGHRLGLAPRSVLEQHR